MGQVINVAFLVMPFTCGLYFYSLPCPIVFVTHLRGDIYSQIGIICLIFLRKLICL